jgi:hypothetical protein
MAVARPAAPTTCVAATTERLERGMNTRAILVGTLVTAAAAFGIVDSTSARSPGIAEAALADHDGKEVPGSRVGGEHTDSDGDAPPDSDVDAQLDDAGQAVIDPGDGGAYTVDIDAAEFSPVVDNEYFPLAPGTRWVYESRAPDDAIRETIAVEVLDENRTVMGVDTIVVHDVVTDADGDVTEDTFDWFAQDAAGNVWYFGEDTTAYEDGVATDAGAWEAGVDGALPGIVMPATPAVSDTGYRQEYLAGEAEDMGQIIAVSGSVAVPFGTYDDVVRTREWTPLEPDVVEEKTYASGVGLVEELTTAGDDAGERVVLVERSTAS